MPKGNSGKKKSTELDPEISKALTQLTVDIKGTLVPLFDEKKCLEPVSKTHNQDYLQEAKKRLKSAADSLSHTSAAFVFAFTDPLDTAACVSAVEALKTCVFELANIAIEIISGVSRPMRKILTKQLHCTCDAVCNFLVHVGKGPECRGDAAAPISGIVLQYCANLAAVDICDPKIARNEALLWMENVKDAISELQELQSGGKDEKGDDVDDDVDDYFGEDEKLTEEELKVREPVILMARSAGVAISTSAKVLRLNACVVDHILDSCSALSVDVDEMCSCVYPPQDCEGIVAAAEKTNAEIIKLQEVTLREIVDSKTEESDGFRKMFAAVVEKSKSMLERIVELEKDK